MNINDKNSDPNVSKKSEYSKLDEYSEKSTKKEKSPSKIKTFAQPILSKKIEPSTNASREQIIPRLKELLSTADKIAPNKNPLTNKTALSALEKSETALDMALRADRNMCKRLSDIAQRNLSASPDQQCRELRDMELYLILLSNHAKSSEFMTDSEKLQLSILVKEVRETIIRFSESTAPKWTTHIDQLETLIKETIPPNKVLPNTPSILETNKGIEIDSKTFATILLDTMISGSKSLEGNSVSVVVHYLKSFLEANQGQYAHMEALPALLKMITDADTHLNAYEGLAAKMRALQNDNTRYKKVIAFDDTLKAYHASLSKLVNELKPGEKTLIPIGWTGTRGGHAMEMGIEREKDGSLRVAIYNSGDGLSNYHPMLFEKGEAFYQPFVVLSGVLDEKLLDLQFSQALLEIGILSHNINQEEYETHYGPKDIYETILNGLGGKIEPCLAEREKFIKPHFSGTCTWGVLSVVMHTNLPAEDHYRIISDVAIGSLCSYYQSVKGQLLTHEEPRIMLQHAAITCTQIALEGSKNQGISLERLQTIHATLKELQDILEAAEAQSNYNKISEKQLAFEKLEPAAPAYLSVTPWEMEKKIAGTPFSLPNVKTSSNIEPFSFDWINDPNQIENGLDQLIKHVKGSYKAETARCLEDFFKLQATEEMENLWNAIPEERLSAVTVKLADLNELLFEVGNVLSNNISRYTTYAYYISAICLLLSRRNPELKQYVEDNGIEYESYVKTVAASLEGSPLKDNNLFNIEDRFLRKKTLEILTSQGNITNHLYLSSNPNWPSFLPAYSSEEPYSTCEMRYINEQLEKYPHLITELGKLYPNNLEVKTDRNWQVALAVCDWYGAVMPLAFCALRRQALAASLISKSQLALGLPFKSEVIERDDRLLGIKFLSKVIDVKKTDDFISDKLFKQVNEIRNKQNEAKANASAIIFDTESDVMFRNLDEWQSNLQLILTQGDLNEKNQFMEQQVIKTISYFSDQLASLEDHDMRMLCRFLLFEENYVEKLLEKNPAASELLAQFVKNGYHYFTERKNIPAAAFFIEIARDMEVIFQFNKNQTIFPDIRKLCLDLLSQRKDNNQEQTLIYQQIAASYTSHPPTDFSSGDAALLLTALLHNEVFALRDHKTTGHTLDQMQRAFWLDEEVIETQLKSEEGSNICHAIIKAFEPTALPQHWDCESKYPLCISQDGLYVINAKNFMIHIKDNPIASLPREIIENGEFKKIFSRKDYTTHRVDWHSYEFTDERGLLTRIDLKNQHGNKVIKISQKFDDGHWYELTSKWKLSESIYLLPENFLKLCESSFLWVPGEPDAPLRIIVKDKGFNTTHTISLMKGVPPPNLTPQEQKELCEFLTGKTHEGIPDIIRKEILTNFQPFKEIIEHLSLDEVQKLISKINEAKRPSIEDFVLETANFWDLEDKSTELKKNEIKNFIIAPPQHRFMEILQKLLPACYNSNKLIMAPVRKENGEDPPLYLVDLKNSPNFPVKELFQEGMLWKDGQGNLKELELPSLGVSFKMQLEGKVWRAYSLEHPDYFVSPNQRYRGLEGIKGALVLESATGKRKLILPYGEIKPKATGSFKTAMDIVIDAETTPVSISYDLDNTSRPIANTKEQQLYLANILFTQKKYEQAQALLRASYSNVLPYHTKEKFLLNQTLTIFNKAKDNSPHAAAVSCTALSLLQQLPNPNQIEGHEKNVLIEQLVSLAQAYKNYQGMTGVVPNLKLTRDEEITVLACLIKALTSLEENKILKQQPEIAELKFTLLNFLALLTDLYEYAKYPDQKTAKNKNITSATKLNNSIHSKFHKEYEVPTLITRPKNEFLKNFYSHYNLAFKDPIKLELSLSAAAQDKNYVPADIVTLLRSAAFCAKHKKKYESDFPPSPSKIKEIIEKENDAEFSKIIKQAQDLEAIILKIKADSREPIVMTGTASTYPRQHEAQKVGQRSDLPSIELAEVPQRNSMLKPTQLDATSPTPKNVSHKDSEKGYFEQTPSYGLQFNDEEILELQQAIRGDNLKVSSVEANERSTNVNAYWSNPEHAAMWHTLKPEKLSNIKTLLLVEKAEMGKRLNLIEQELLQFANDLPEDTQEALLFEMEKMGNLRQPISMRDIIIFTARASNFSLAGKNPSLASIEKELLDKSILYFDAKAQQQQLGRAIASINTLEKIDYREDGMAYARLSEICYKELTRQPPYKAHEHPELLMFEVLEEIGLHDWQVKDLERMLRPKQGENSNIILEKVMGSGKTKVYLPLLALSKADGEFIPFIVVHSSQYDSVAPTLQIKSGQNFSQVAHTLTFSRDSDTSLEALQKIRDECFLVQKQRHFFVVTDKSMHSLSLAFTQLWDTYLSREKEDSSLAARIEVFREIIDLLKTKGKAILDEADLLLNCRYEVVYSLGDPQAIKGAHADVVADLYKSIASHLEALTPFTKADYLSKKSEMIQSFIDHVVASEMQNCDQTNIFDYLNGGKEGAAYVDTLPGEQRNLLAIAFYEFDELLPIVLDRRCNEHYGYSTNPNKILPVPYVASGVPSPTAEFSFPYALLDYAIQTLKNDGVTPSLLKRLVQEMQSRASKEQKADPRIALQDTQGYQAFYELCGKDSRSKVSIPFLKVNESDIAKLVKMYKENPPDIYEFAKKYVNSAVTIHPRKLVSTPYTLGNMFYEKQGFTGTPWNNQTFPKDMETLRDVNSAGKTEGIIWKNSQIVHTLTSDNFKQTIEEIKQIQADGTYHAFIDVGAIFNGYDNQTVASDLLESLPPSIKGVLFFKDNRACVLERGKKDPVLYQPGTSTENLYIFYDQWHTTGTDFPIAGKSLISIGKNTKMRDLEQGYMRDRKAAQGKRVEFILSKEASGYIQKELHLPKDKKVGTAEILRSTQLNQDSELDEQLMMASFGRIKETENNHLNSVLCNPQIPPYKIHAKAKIIHSLIGDDVKDSPYDDFGRYKEDLDAKDFFVNITNKSVEKMKDLLEDKELCPPGLTPEVLKEELWGCIDLHLLPAKISAIANNAPNQLIEQQSQLEVQQERMAMVNKELMTDIESESRNGPVHWNFDSSQKSYLSSFYRLIEPQGLANVTLPLLGKADTPCLIPISQGQAPFISLSAIFAANESLKEFSDVFDIEVSYNFLPVRGNARENKDFIPIQTAPFQKGQLNVKNMLICKNNRTEDVQVRLLSQADTGFFFNHLAERPHENDREVDATLYHLSLKTYQSNNEAIATGKENIVEGAVLRKIVQAKFFNGESIYTKEESVYLSAWIKEKGQKRMERLFMEHILPSKKDDKQQEYPGSVLSKLFSA